MRRVRIKVLANAEPLDSLLTPETHRDRSAPCHRLRQLTVLIVAVSLPACTQKVNT